MQKYAGKFEGRWGVTEIIAFENSLLAFSPSADRPLEYALLLEYKDNDNFIIHSNNGYESIGEKVEFTFSNNKTLTGMIWGSHYLKVSSS